ncbi:hypothetical protein [Paraburkholderia sp. 22B1P]|uniref:hypothetical protein n=1 Tax=Paraburkholderia sp. 22B1P TaxID=3080498 RepID=UPI00308F0545|nr:hypothetical protein PBP221_81780 [Paraburkholderia sp. 22B1P]
MNDLSVRGVYRRYVVEPRIAFFGTADPAIVGDLTNMSIAKDILWTGTGWVRSPLELLARKVVGPATWYQNVCENVKGTVCYVQTWTHIDVRILLNLDAGIDAAMQANIENTWKNGIEGTWNSPVPSVGASPRAWKCARQGEAPCRVSFKVHWVGNNPHHYVNVHTGSGREDEYTWYTMTLGSTAAHEFGHMLGLPDEYIEEAVCPGRAPVGTGTIMANDSTYIPQRLVQWVSDEIGSDLQ